MRISVRGLGYVGTVTVPAIRDGHAPMLEPGVANLIGEAVRSGQLRATSDIAEAIPALDMSAICVGTPSEATATLT